MDQDSKLVWINLNRIDNLTFTDLSDREYVEVVETGADTGNHTAEYPGFVDPRFWGVT